MTETRGALPGAAEIMPTLPPNASLCYMCALRFSTMFQLRPPPPLQEQLRKLASSAREECVVADDNSRPLIDRTYHPHFALVYETKESSWRFFAHGKDGERLVPNTSLPFLCCACFGLYQFIDFCFAPMLAAQIRASPYFDSQNVSVNVNAHRSGTFLWLAAATIFYDMKGQNELPRAMGVIPEEHTSFKEFYMGDLRARTLQYLLVPHHELQTKFENGSAPVGYEVYRAACAKGSVALDGSDATVSDEPACKAQRTEEKSLLSGKVVCSQGFQYSAFNEGVIAEVECWHEPSEKFVTEGLVPMQYCSNKPGCVMSYSVIYDHVFPVLQKDRGASSQGALWASEELQLAKMRCAVSHTNLYLMGSYRKMSRTMAQSPWFTDGNRVGSISLQEVIADPFLDFFFPNGVPSATLPSSLPNAVVERLKASSARPTCGSGQGSAWQDVDPFQQAMEHVRGYGSYKFHSAGREDVDVRMLGTGRPFVLELVSPHRERISAEDIRALEAKVNASEQGAVEVFDTAPTDAEITVRLARHSESKTKHYRCVVWCSRPVENPLEDERVLAANAVKDLTIIQRTPMRVLHRRSLLPRPRTIHSLKLEAINRHWFLADIETQAGTYVKEFVHGDMGRTFPNLGSLLHGRTDIIQLDVLGMTTDGLTGASPSGTDISTVQAENGGEAKRGFVEGT